MQQLAFPYQSRAIPPTVPAPVVSNWCAQPAGPVTVPKATPWNWQFETEPDFDWLFNPAKSELPFFQLPGPVPRMSPLPHEWPFEGTIRYSWLPTPLVSQFQGDLLPGPVTMPLAAPHLHRLQNDMQYAWLPAPIVSQWVSPQPGPTTVAKANPWVWQFETEPLAKWQFNPSIAELPLFIPPGPVKEPVAVPQYYPYEGTIRYPWVPIPTVDRWEGAL